MFHAHAGFSCLQNYCVQGLELFASFLFRDILELYDWNLAGTLEFGLKIRKLFHTSQAALRVELCVATLKIGRKNNIFF